MEEKTGRRSLDKFKPCYLYIGSNSLLLKEKIEDIKIFLKNKINSETDLKIYDANDEINETDFDNFLNMPSLFSPRKVLILENVDRAKTDIIKKLIVILSQNVNKLQDLIVLLTATKDSFNKKLIEAINNIGEVRKLKAAGGENAKKLLEARIRKDGISFTEEAKELLLESVNFNAALLKREYQKLFLLILSDQDKVINPEIVNRMVSRVYDFKIFDLVDCLGKKDKNNSFIASNALLKEGQNFMGLITLLHRMFKCMLYIKSEDGYSLATRYMEKNMKMPPYFIGKMISKYIKFSNNYSLKEIIKIIKTLNRYDLDSRTSSVGGRNFMMMLINEITEVKIPS